MNSQRSSECHGMSILGGNNICLNWLKIFYEHYFIVLHGLYEGQGVLNLNVHPKQIQWIKGSACTAASDKVVSVDCKTILNCIPIPDKVGHTVLADNLLCHSHTTIV
jgi:hypothetical protein